jgi:hypothetical protein
VHPRAIRGEVGGVRVSVERTAGRDPHIIIDTEAQVDLARLRVALAESVPGATAAAVGRAARVVLAWDEMEPQMLDNVLDAVMEARRIERGAYR